MQLDMILLVSIIMTNFVSVSLETLDDQKKKTELLILVLITSPNYIILLYLLIVNKYKALKTISFVFFFISASLSCLLSGKTPASIYLVSSQVLTLYWINSQDNSTYVKFVLAGLKIFMCLVIAISQGFSNEGIGLLFGQQTLLLVLFTQKTMKLPTISQELKSEFNSVPLQATGSTKRICIQPDTEILNHLQIDQHNCELTIQDICSQIPQGILILDKDLKIKQVNQLFLQYTNCEDQSNLLIKLNSMISQQNFFLKQQLRIEELDENSATNSLGIFRLGSTFHLKKVSSGRFASSRFNSYQQDRQILPLQSDSNRFSNVNRSLLGSSGDENQLKRISISFDKSLFYLKNILLTPKLNQSHNKIIYRTKINDENKDLKFRFIRAKKQKYDNDKDTHEPFYIITIEDITKRKELKSIEKKFQFQRRLLDSFSHELKTPMNASIQLLQCLENKVEQHLNHSFIVPALISSKRLLFQINDIIDFGQIESENFSLQTSIFTIDSLIQELFYLFEEECKQKSIQLTHHYESQNLKNKEIKSDKNRILSILINLINNSIKFTPCHGQITVEVQQGPNYPFEIYQFTVVDNGKGINEEQLLGIQLALQLKDENDKIQSQYDQYFGLGLKISNLIARKLSNYQGGSLLIDSQEKSYTSVQFYVENQLLICQTYDHIKGTSLGFLEEVEEESIMEKQVPSIVYQSKTLFLKSFNEQFKKCNCIQILICDDVPFNHFALQKMLNQIKFDASSAFDGEQCIKIIEERIKNPCRTCQSIFKLILMDIEMPGINGFQTTERIFELLKKNQSNYSQINIVLCSAYNGNDMIKKAKDIGMCAILPKPINPKDLKQIINQFVLC